MQKIGMDGELKQKILRYADTAYAAAYHTSLLETTRRIAELTALRTSKGSILSGGTVVETAKLHGEHINTVVQAKADALLDAYELYGAEIDDSILIETSEMRWRLIDAISANEKSAGLPPGMPVFNLLREQLVTNTGAITNTIECQIERRKLVPKLRQTGSVQNVYHLHGHNSRVNIQSTDNSTNKVNLTSNELFLQLREKLSNETDGEVKVEILERLDELEKAQNTPGFGLSYTKFMAVAADHWTLISPLISPFLPALTELLHKALGG